MSAAPSCTAVGSRQVASSPARHQGDPPQGGPRAPPACCVCCSCLMESLDVEINQVDPVEQDERGDPAAGEAAIIWPRVEKDELIFKATGIWTCGPR